MLTTPYAAAHKYLAKAEGDAGNATSTDVERMTSEIMAEQNNPMYNPDLTTSKPRQGSWFSRKS